MARDKLLKVCALNISASPHPDGIYPTLLRRASQFYVQARGSDYAKISRITKVDRHDHLYSGRILVWTEIDVKGSWLNISNEDEIPAHLKEAIKIPPDAKPNYRSFDFIFDEKKHVMYYESRNVLDDSLGPTTAKRIISRLLSQELLGLDSPEVTVTIVPEDGAVQKILSLPGLRTLIISITRPNPDASSSSARKRVFDELQKAGAQRLEQKYTKSAGVDHLTPTPLMRDYAEVGGEDGYVQGEGRDPNGKRLVVSTNEYPKRYYVSHEAGGNFLARLLSTIRIS